jgi:hypothetical protein
VEGKTILLIIALLVVWIFIKWNENKNWETIYEGSSTSIRVAQSKFAFLKANGVRCRMKTISPRIASQSVNPSMQTTVRVLVNKKDLSKAYSLFSDYSDK